MPNATVNLAFRAPVLDPVGDMMMISPAALRSILKCLLAKQNSKNSASLMAIPGKLSLNVPSNWLATAVIVDALEQK